jgi:hypothetical protein
MGLSLNPLKPPPPRPMIINYRNVIHSAFVGAILLSFWAGVASGQTGSASPNRPVATATPALSESSQAVLQLRLQTVAKDIGELQDEVKQLESFQGIVSATLKKFEGFSVPSIDQQVEAARVAFQKVKDAWKPNNAAVFATTMVDFSTTISNLERVALSINRETESVRTAAFPRSSFAGPVQSKLPSSLGTVVEQKLIFYSDEKWGEQLPNLNRAYLAGVQIQKPSELAQRVELSGRFLPGGTEALPITEAERELGTVKKAFSDLFSHSIDSRRSGLKAIDEAATSEIAQAKKALEARQKEEADIDAKLKTKEDAQASIADETSGKLQYIFWGIMAAIIATLIILRFKGDEQSQLMIRERTAVEMLSIGMFLTTVLFLGTGGFIEKATLGTLLGTLAGYLFTRRPGTAPDAAATGTSDRPEAPAQPVYDKTSNTVSLPSYPKNADHITVYARPAGGGAEVVLGSSKATTVPVDTSNLPKGDYKGWVVATNVSGGSSKSPEFDLKKD